MPADAIHLAALEDLGPAAAPHWPAEASWQAARLGAVFIDLPGYERFTLTLLAHLAGRELSWSDWGHRFHAEKPVAFIEALLAEARALREAKATRAQADWLAAFALGVLCHAAIDRALHPLINRLAAARTSGRPLVREHQEVEKLQSILFHRVRFGRELRGTQALLGYVGVDGTPLLREPTLEAALFRATAQTYGVGLERGTLARWLDGFGSYVRVLAGPLGTLAVTEDTLERERPAVYQAPDFERRFHVAVGFAARCVGAGASLLDTSHPAADALTRVLPEGTLDPVEDGVGG